VEEIITSAKPASSSRNGRGRIGVAVPGGFRVFSGGAAVVLSRNTCRGIRIDPYELSIFDYSMLKLVF